MKREAGKAKASGNESGSAGKVLPLFSRPEHAARLFLKARLLDEQKEHWKDAERLYREVVRIAPGHVEAWINLGVMCFHQKRPGEALHCWGRAIIEDPMRAETHNNIGQLYKMEGKLEQSAVYLFRAVRLDPDMEEALFNLAMCLQGLGRPRAALRYWRRYIERWPYGEWIEHARRHFDWCERAASMDCVGKRIAEARARSSNTGRTEGR
ncbi:MAG TPA: tetratricopeptide repeat protein [Polyangiaceae bacterium]